MPELVNIHGTKCPSCWEGEAEASLVLAYVLTSSLEGHFVVFYFCSTEAEFIQMPGASFQLRVCPHVLGRRPAHCRHLIIWFCAGEEVEEAVFSDVDFIALCWKCAVFIWSE